MKKKIARRPTDLSVIIQLSQDNSNLQGNLKRFELLEVLVIDSKISNKMTWMENKFTLN